MRLLPSKCVVRFVSSVGASDTIEQLQLNQLQTSNCLVTPAGQTHPFASCHAIPSCIAKCSTNCQLPTVLEHLLQGGHTLGCCGHARRPRADSAPAGAAAAQGRCAQHDRKQCCRWVQYRVYLGLMHAAVDCMHAGVMRNVCMHASSDSGFGVLLERVLKALISGCCCCCAARVLPLLLLLPLRLLLLLLRLRLPLLLLLLLLLRLHLRLLLLLPLLLLRLLLLRLHLLLLRLRLLLQLPRGSAPQMVSRVSSTAPCGTSGAASTARLGCRHST